MTTRSRYERLRAPAWIRAFQGKLGDCFVALLLAVTPPAYAVSLRYSVNPSLLKLPYDPIKDFEPVMMTAAVGNVLVVNSKMPINSVKELIAVARQKPDALTFASSGIGGAPHLSVSSSRCRPARSFATLPTRAAALRSPISSAATST